MMKIYYTNLGNLTTFVQVKGKKRYVDFISSDNKTGYFLLIMSPCNKPWSEIRLSGVGINYIRKSVKLQNLKLF
ncbi:MAG: hypothetical protein ACLSG8_00715 [Barnesiella sp.]